MRRDDCRCGCGGDSAVTASEEWCMSRCGAAGRTAVALESLVKLSHGHQRSWLIGTLKVK